MRVRDAVALARGAVGHSPAIQGMIPAAAGFFAVATGIASCVLLRRTLPAMAATIAIFVVVRLMIGSQVRPHFATAETLVVAFDGPSPLTGTGAGYSPSGRSSPAVESWGPMASLNLGNLVDRCSGLDVGPGAFPDHPGRRSVSRRYASDRPLPPGRPVLAVPADRDGTAGRPGRRSDEYRCVGARTPHHVREEPSNDRCPRVLTNAAPITMASQGSAPKGRGGEEGACD